MRGPGVATTRSPRRASRTAAGAIFGGVGRANTSRSWTISFNPSIRVWISSMTARSGAPSSIRPPIHLEGATDSRERILDLVGNDGRHLSEASERLLFPQLGLGSLALGDLEPDRHVLIRRSVVVQERHDRGVDPVQGSPLGHVLDLTGPDLPSRNRGPQLAEELLRVSARVEEAMVLPQQLRLGVSGDLTEPLVHVGDPPPPRPWWRRSPIGQGANFVSWRSLRERSGVPATTVGLDGIWRDS